VKNTKTKKMFDDRLESMKTNKINPDEFLLKYGEFEKLDMKRIASNQVLTNFRLERTRKELPKTKVMTNFIIDDKMNLKVPGKVGLLDVLMQDKANLVKEPKLQLPPTNDKLWVIKPIGTHVII